jgi:hypothetical protein
LQSLGALPALGMWAVSDIRFQPVDLSDFQSLGFCGQRRPSRSSPRAASSVCTAQGHHQVCKLRHEFGKNTRAAGRPLCPLPSNRPPPSPRADYVGFLTQKPIWPLAVKQRAWPANPFR